MHDFGKVSFLVISEDFRGANQEPASTAFRYVIISDTHIPIPEPSTLALLSMGTLALTIGWCRRKR